LLAEVGAFDRGLKVRTLTLPDRFLEHDTPAVQLAAAGLDTRSIVAGVLGALGRAEADVQASLLSG
jgi:1-deoxy-D-xylulose-5-phosphate synthase